MENSRVGTFLTPLKTERMDHKISKLTAKLIFSSARYGEVIIVPKGFLTDFASVPRLPFAYLLCGGIGDRAAVVHDYLYTCRDYPRKRADGIFLEALEAVGVGWFRRRAMWAAVRCFGGFVRE